MANLNQLQALLKLPSALRIAVIRPLNQNLLQQPTLKCRFGTSACLQAGNPSKAAPPPPRPRVIRQSGSQSPQATPPQGQSPPQSTPNAQPIPTLTGLRGRKFDAEIRRQMEKTGQILLYQAPSHTSFIITAYLFGAVFIIGAVYQFSYTREDKKMPFSIRLVIAGVGLFYAIWGTIFFLSPAKLIRSISLVQNHAGVTPSLRFESRQTIPFARVFNIPMTVDAAMQDVYIDQKMVGAELPPFNSVAPNEIEKMTDRYPIEIDPPPRWTNPFFRQLEPLRKPGRILKRDVRRMFMRDSMLYVRIGDRGHWKLDLYNAVLLDNGKPLTMAMIPAQLDRTLWTSIRNLLGY